MYNLTQHQDLIKKILTDFDSSFLEFKHRNKGPVQDLLNVLKMKGRKAYEISNNNVIGKLKGQSIDGFCIIENHHGIYIGELKGDKKNGFAYNRFTNGLVFRGVYKDNLKISGQVLSQDLSRAIYEGFWDHDTYH